jgi:iron complex outermembrane receptor protein
MMKAKLTGRPKPPTAATRSARQRRKSGFVLGAGSLLALLLLPSAGRAAPDDFSVSEAVNAPLEELMKISVTTVAGQEEDWFRSPAAMYVLTSEDIRRTGHRTVADALRAVPGVFVGMRSSHEWVVGMRGFTGGLANKTLVLVDGRAVYDPLFGGTFWDVQNMVLADIDRIEVIRGPGATLWGANAVNGVINIITKDSIDTQGILAIVGGGNEYEGYATARYGGQLFEGGTYRIWGKYFNNDHYMTPTGSAHDAWDLGNAGFRFDYDDGENTHVLFEGSIFNSWRLGEQVAIPVPDRHFQFNQRVGNGRAHGGNLLARVEHEYAPGAGVSLQAYYDRSSRIQQAGLYLERDTGDVDLRHHFRVGDRHEVIWGVADRFTADRTRSSADTGYVFDPRSRDFNTVSGFVQDTVTLVPDRVFAMLGTKLEYNSYTGFEVQPSGRLWWTDDRNTLWASVSRPVRVPSRIEQDAFVTFAVVDTGQIAGQPPTGIYIPLGVQGSRSLESEELIAYEIGYRRRLAENLTIDIAPYYNDYSRLLYLPKTVFGTWTDAGSGESYGVEVTTAWQALEQWKLEASYSYVDVQIHGDLTVHDQLNSPHHQFKMRSYWNITDTVECNTALYYVDEYRMEEVPDYVRLDQGFTWHATPNVDFTIWGQNLLDDRHREVSRTIQMERSVYAEVAFHFD